MYCHDCENYFGEASCRVKGLTGPCTQGRKEWCRAHGYKPTDSITVRTFIEKTRHYYGGDVINQLAEAYGIVKEIEL